MQAKEQIPHLPVYKPGKPIEEVKREYGLDEIIKLASNENPFGASPQVKEALQKEAANMALYPDGASYNLRQGLARFYDVNEDQIVFGNGSDEIISFITRVYLDANANTIMATPTFPIYKTNAVIEGAEVIEVPLKDGVHDLETMKGKVNDQTKVIWICNPNNPSGTYVSEDRIVAFLESISSDILVVLDEAYCEYASAEDYPDSTKLIDRFPNLFVMRTFSKIYGLASLRIGYGIGQASVVDLLNRVRAPFNANRFAQAAALAGLEDQDYVKECYDRNLEGLQQFYRAFEDMGLSYYPSQGNFVLVDTKRSGNEVFEALLKQGIIVRSGEALGFPTSIRITVGSQEQNEKIINVLKETITEGAS
ncbi:histidinol-phosphate transaminase [Caldalkalibacillus salinus]|uniref:histidinol-phosphate transaminase n=1 Tax=Caldalkalibacillus salinus TaxID=2803787 RepID=UPI00192283A6|nr:histidinol-phosphate transaminase [Caldalkalibacillus salinus]